MSELHLGLKPETTQKSEGSSVLIKSLVFAGVVAGILVFGLVARFFFWARSSELRAFRIPSDSMCPAICANERIFAGMDAFNRRVPERGEVILFDHKASKAKFLKRVVAVGGDTVAPGSNGAVLVNGNEVKFPETCGSPIQNRNRASKSFPFEPQTVPKDSYFVVGDNMNNSFDSRITGFGYVQRDEVRGKALLIYWSPGGSRIGCKIE
jgi:signal peptidase I